MTTKTKRFKKGQVVFLASSNFSTVGNGERNGHLEFVALGLVMKRTVDACGVKQMTFEDHGNDSVFGRSERADAPYICATESEAFEYLRSNSHVDVICKKVYSDSNREAFDELRSGALIISQK